MSNLLWWNGITWNTPVNNIGWIWVLLAVFIVTFLVSLVLLIKEVRNV